MAPEFAGVLLNDPCNPPVVSKIISWVNPLVQFGQAAYRRLDRKGPRTLYYVILHYVLLHNASVQHQETPCKTRSNLVPW